mgnify:CR=1|tara:strand:- start:2781 stop:3005 length:225 start_codon:yes stop_codon:yes gene_type:complete
MPDYLALLKDKDGCLSSKRISLLILVVTIPPILYWVISYLMGLGKADNITDIVKTLLWSTISLGGAVASERFRK